jgi:uncharacterized iron-regulated membrane protein
MALLPRFVTYVLATLAVGAFLVVTQAVLILMWEQRRVWRLPLREGFKAGQQALTTDRARRAMARAVVAAVVVGACVIFIALVAALSGDAT